MRRYVRGGRRMRWLGVATALLASANAHAIEPTIEAGVGLPELAHVRVGAFANPRLAIHVHASNVVLNWIIGLSATGYLLGVTDDGPPRHALLARGTLGFNPLAAPIRLRSGGDTIGAAGLLEGGYGFAASGGFLIHATLGALLYVEEVPAAAPTISAGVGWRF